MIIRNNSHPSGIDMGAVPSRSSILTLVGSGFTPMNDASSWRDTTRLWLRSTRKPVSVQRDILTLKCEMCEGEFKATHGYARTCSARCRKRLQRMTKKGMAHS